MAKARWLRNTQICPYDLVLKPVILMLINKESLKLEDNNTPSQKPNQENSVESTNNAESQSTPESKQVGTKFNIEDRGENAPLLTNAAKINPYNRVNTIMAIALSLGIVILLGGGVYLYKTKANNKPISSHQSSSHQMVPPGIRGDSNNPLEQINLSPLPPYSGTATATRIFKNNKYSLTIDASTNPPSEGKYFEGWIYHGSKDPKYISVGRLMKMDDEYMLEYSTEQDYMDYNSVFITEQSESSRAQNTPDTHTFHGDF